MPRLPRLTASEVLSVLRRAGWFEHHQTGSHVQMKHPSLSGRVTVPRHARVTLHPKTLSTILDQAGMTVEELREFL